MFSRSTSKLLFLVVILGVIHAIAFAQFDPVKDALKNNKKPPTKSTPTKSSGKSRPKPKPRPPARASFSELMAQAWNAIDRDQISSASSLLTKASAAKPGNHGVTDALSYVLYKSGKKDAASAKANAAVNSGQPCLIAHLVKGLLAKSAGDEDTARSELTVHNNTRGAHKKSYAMQLLASIGPKLVVVHLLPPVDQNGAASPAKIELSSDYGAIAAATSGSGGMDYHVRPNSTVYAAVDSQDKTSYDLVSKSSYDVANEDLEIRPIVKRHEASSNPIEKKMGKVVVGSSQLQGVQITIGNQTTTCGTPLDLEANTIYNMIAEIDNPDRICRVGIDNVRIDAGQTTTVPLGVLSVKPSGGSGTLTVALRSGTKTFDQVTDKGVRIPILEGSYDCTFTTDDGVVTKHIDVKGGEEAVWTLEPAKPALLLPLKAIDRIGGQNDQFRMQAVPPVDGHLLCLFLRFDASGGSKVVPYFPNRFQPVDAVIANSAVSFPPKKAKENGSLVCCGPGYYVAVITDRELDPSKLYGSNMSAEEILPSLKKLASESGIRILAAFEGNIRYEK